MAFIQQLSGHRDTSGSDVAITVPAGGIPAGHLLVLGMGSNATTLPTAGVTDSAGNTWSLDGQIQAGASCSAHQLRAVVGNSLAAGDVVTLALASGPLSRIPVSVMQFDDGIIAIDNGHSNENGGASSNVPTAGPFSTTHASTLIVATFSIASSGRNFTPAAGYTAGTKVVTTNGAGDRAVIQAYRYATTIDTYEAAGTLNSASIYAATSRSYALGDPGSPGGTGKAKVFVGGAWTSHPFKTWNGTAWQTHLGKRWNGTAWIPIT